MPDAPDYTLLSDVNVVGSVTLNVNVVGTVDVNIASQTVALNVTLVGSTVTLDVNIVSQAAALNVNITGSAITLNVNIASQEVPLNVNVTGSTVTLNVNVTNTTLNVNITGQTAALDVRLTASTITLDVNITGSTVTMNVNITGSAITLNVNVTNTTLNVNITGSTVTMNVNITNPVIPVGQVQPSLSFGGVNEYGKIEPFTVYGWSEITIEEWIYPVRPNATADWSVMSHIGDPWVDRPSTHMVSDPAFSYMFVRLVTRKPDGTPAYYDYNILPWVNQWVHVVRRLKSNREYSVFVNGEIKYNATIPSDQKTILEWDPDTATYPFRYRRFVLGANVNLTQNKTVRYRLLRIYNRALSNSEIQHNYNNPEMPVTGNLKVWLKFSEGAGTTAYDYSGNNNHATIYGATWVSSQGQVPALINVNITGQVVPLNVNITGSTVTLNVNIASQTTTLNVNIVSSVVLNVSVQGVADIRITGQQVGVIIEGTWRSIHGQEVNLVNTSLLLPFASHQPIEFSPTTERYQIEAINAGYEMAKDTIYRPHLVIFDVYIGTDKIATLNLTAEKPTDYVELLRGISVIPGRTLRVFIRNQSPVMVRVFVSVMMYRVG